MFPGVKIITFDSYWLTFVILHVLVDSVKSLETLEDDQIILISALVGGSVLLGAVLIVVACLCMNKYVIQHNNLCLFNIPFFHRPIYFL